MNKYFFISQLILLGIIFLIALGVHIKSNIQNIKNSMLLIIIITVILLFMISIGSLVINKETFQTANNILNSQDILNKITNFQTQLSDISNSTDLTNSEQISDIQDKLKTLTNDSKTILNLLDEAITQSNLSYEQRTVNYENSNNTLTDLANRKTILETQIQELQSQLNKAQQLASTNETIKETNKYQPIKIYSSCVISEANGTYTT